MSSVRGSAGTNGTSSPDGHEPQRLPTRWFIIALLGGAAYVAGDQASGVVAGIGAAVAVVGLLHQILDD